MSHMRLIITIENQLGLLTATTVRSYSTWSTVKGQGHSRSRKQFQK